MGEVPENRDVELHRELLVRIGKGEESALSQLYDLLAAPLASLAYRILGNREEVQEVLQDVFVAIWNHAGNYDPKLSRPFSWMIVITRRLCWNRLRSRGRHQRKLKALEESGRGPVIPLSEKVPSEQVEGTELSESVQHRMKSLPEAQERVLHMSLFDGFTHEEIAGILDLPLGTVKTWIRRGLMKVKEQLEVES